MNKGINVLVGDNDKEAGMISDYLHSKGINTFIVERNPLKIQFEVIKNNYNAVLISHRTKYPRALCENLKSLDDPPSIMLMSNSDFTAGEELSRYLDGEIKNPYDFDLLYSKIIESVRHSENAAASSAKAHYSTDKEDCELHNEITKIITRLCVTPRYNGYNYIREAIKLAVGDDGGLKGISKEIYPEIARKLGVTALGVERSIRTAIHRSWEKAEASAKIEIFGTYALSRDWVPTNSEFIFIIADKISCQMKSAANL